MSVTGALVIDKPEGPTSHDIVALIRRSLRTRVGHTGTLDPLASGVLVLLLGKATRLMSFFQGDDKVYQAEVELGAATDTYDREGRTTLTGQPPSMSESQCRELLARFQGEIQQQPPLYSAVKVDGERLYKAARRGDQPERPHRTVTIYSLLLLERTDNVWILHVHCSSGTYIRSLADEIGKALGCGAHLRRLRRERSGDYAITQAVVPSLPADQLRARVIPVEEMLTRLPRVDLSELDAKRVRHGNAIALKWTPPPADAYRLFDRGELIALGRRRLSQIQPFVVLV